MSNALAIAATSAVLKDLIEQRLRNKQAESGFTGDALQLTSKTPDLIQTGETEPAHLNLFLYHVTVNSSWRNVGLASRGARADMQERLSNPPLALDLHYLLSAYGAEDFQPEALLGYGMEALHETPVITRERLRTLFAGEPAGSFKSNIAASRLADQVEILKITPQTLSNEEISRLWTAFQAKYRLSAAYMVTVVLIEDNQVTRTPLPVIQRGENDRGPNAIASTVSPVPEITRVVTPLNRPWVEWGERIRLIGHNFAGKHSLTDGIIQVRFEHHRANDLVNITVNPSNIDNLEVILNNNALLAGLNMMSTTFTKVDTNSNPIISTQIQSNKTPLLVAPKIITPLPANFTIGINSLSFAHTVTPSQQVLLLLNEHAFLANTRPTDTNTLDFKINGIEKGDYRVRVQIDGVDSILIGNPDPQTGVVTFDNNKQIRIN